MPCTGYTSKSSGQGEMQADRLVDRQIKIIMPAVDPLVGMFVTL